MARDTWFETVAIAQQRAKKRLPKSVYSSRSSASEKGVTVSDNVSSFSELGFAPHVVGALEKRDLSTTVMGQDISLPVIISPAGVQAVAPRGAGSGAVGMIATTDWSFSHGRDWGSPSIPEQMDLKTMLKMSPEVLTKPRW